MSRLKPRASANPAKIFAQWSGDEGKLSYWDKEASENVELELPFTFLVLDELNTVKGFNEKLHAGYYSNEVYDITNDELRVKTKNGLAARGTWNDIKGDLLGAQYCKSIYIAYKDETGELVLGNLQIKGSALTAWINFTKTYDPYKGAIKLVGPSDPKKKGKTVYYEPVFEGMNVSDATNDAALELNRELDEYLKGYFNQKVDQEAEVVADDDVEDDEQEATPAPKRQAAPKAKKEDEKIDLSEVPF